MDIHIQKYLKLRSGRDISLDLINKSLNYINNNNNKFDISRKKKIETLSENIKYIIDNNIPIKYDNSEETFKLKCIDSNYGIFIIDNFLDDEKCANLINLIENSNQKHFGFTADLLYSNKSLDELFIGKKTIDMDLNDFLVDTNTTDKNILDKINKEKQSFINFNNHIKYKLNNIARIFKNFYLWSGNNHETSDITLTKYFKETGGYSYHNDYIFGNTKTRLMSFVIYLNNVYNGGETKFLHQNKKVKPLTGRLLIFPPTHNYIHIGLPSISNEKYIITSFLEI